MGKYLIHVVALGLAGFVLAADYNQEYDVSRSVEADFRAAVKDAQAADKRIFIELGTEWCSWCKTFEKHVSGDPELNSLLYDNFIVLKIRAWGKGENGRFQRSFAEVGGVPSFLVADKNGVVQMSFGYDRDTIKENLQKAVVYELIDPVCAVDADESTSVLVPEYDTLRIPTHTLEPIKGVRIKAGYSLEETSTDEKHARIFIAHSPFGRRDLQIDLGRTMHHDTWEEFLFPAPVNGDYLLVTAGKEPVRVFELEYIMGDSSRSPSDVSPEELLPGKILCREYRLEKSFRKLPPSIEESGTLVSEKQLDSFSVDLTENERGRKCGFIETVGYIRIDEPGTYTFRLNSVGLAKFSVGGIPLITQMDYNTNSKYTGTLELEKGFYAYQMIYVPYYEDPMLEVEMKQSQEEFLPLSIDRLYVKAADS